MKRIPGEPIRNGNPLTFRASTKEKQLLQDAAKRLGTTRGALVRSAALALADELLAV